MDRVWQGHHLSASDVASFIRRVFDKTTRALKLTSCRSTTDAAGPPPRTSGAHAESSRPSDVHRRSSVSAPTRPLLSRLGGSEQHGPSAQVSTQPRRLSPVRPQSGYFGDEAGPSSAAPHPTPPPPATYYGTSAWPSSAAPSYHAGPSSQYTWTPVEPSQSSYPSQEDEAGLDTAYDIVRDFFEGTPDYDVLQRSQVSSAPLRTQPTHDEPSTPVVPTRPNDGSDLSEWTVVKSCLNDCGQNFTARRTGILLLPPLYDALLRIGNRGYVVTVSLPKVNGAPIHRCEDIYSE
ncbi:uncharacterized protein LOC133917323 [Phragmites australis]|uniref:uncharacterized protein LOC133917323 n=1 Tax=Phragmites australis TaxID=29695 RepID=UPI002D783476|nr:uncharacterized protein LOC133917323 [Phragmites australis]